MLSEVVKSIVFDLDDTLYPERDYVVSGFRHVANYLAKEYGLHANEVFHLLMNDFDAGLRGKNFDALVEKIGIKGHVSVVPELVREYRRHMPSMKLPDISKEVIAALKERGVLVGIVTDGHIESQRNKVDSLELATLMDAIVYTDVWGRDFWKPHPRGFIEICRLLEVEAKEAVYVADNPEKDFKGAKDYGMYTIQLRHWANRDAGMVPEAYRPDSCVDSLEDLLKLFPVRRNGLGHEDTL